MMKKILKSKVTMVILACLLLVGVFAGVSVLANDAPTVAFDQVNIDHSDGNVKILYKMNVTNASASATVVVNFWGAHPTEKDDNGQYLNAELSATAEAADESGAVWTALSKGFAPAEMTQVVYAQAVCTDGDKVGVSEVYRYSVFQYLCESNKAGGSTAQESLWAAMENYITYAQKYLSYTDNSSPADLVYLKVNNGYIQAKDGSDSKYTSGVFVKGSALTIVADLPEGVEFGRWHNGSVYLLNENQRHDTYSFALNGDREYTAVPKATVTVADGELTPVTETVKGGYPYYTPSEDSNFTEATGYAGWYAVTAEATKTEGEGDTAVTKYFSHWTDADGNYVSSNLTYVFDIDLVGTTENKAYSFTANYTEQSNAQSVTMNVTNTASDDGTYAASTYDIYDPETGIFNSSTRPAVDNDQATDNSTNYGGGGLKFSGTSNYAESVVNRMIYSFKLKIDPRDLGEGETLTGNNNCTEYFVNSRSSCHYQIGLGVVGEGTNNGIIFINVEAIKNPSGNGNLNSNLEGYYLSFCEDSSPAITHQLYNSATKKGLMSYGEEYEITLEIVNSETETAGTYELGSVNAYINGEYVGTATVPTTYEPTYTASGSHYFTIATLKRTRSKATFTDLTVTEIADYQ